MRGSKDPGILTLWIVWKREVQVHLFDEQHFQGAGKWFEAAEQGMDWPTPVGQVETEVDVLETRKLSGQ